MAFTVPGYLVDQLLGYGSNAEVWSARAATTAERVALKRFVLPSSLGDPRLAAQQAAGLARSARSEAALLAALEHPSLIRLREFVQTPAAVVLVMDLAEGGSLAQLLRRRDRLSPAEVAAALSPVAAALAYAHDEAVLHGDVSAANILFTAACQPKLADLGVARMLIGHSGPERSLGTPAYVDPVLAAGGAAGAASDVFSLAAVALHCLTGTGPWQLGDRAGVQAVLARAATGVIDDLPAKLAGCPEAMTAVIVRGLDPEPHRRGTAAEFALDLRASVQPAPVVLTAGRIGAAGIGRHSADRRDHEAAGGFAVAADLTHVSRLQVRQAPVESRRSRPLPRLSSAARLPSGVRLPSWIRLPAENRRAGTVPGASRLRERCDTASSAGGRRLPERPGDDRLPARPSAGRHPDGSAVIWVAAGVGAAVLVTAVMLFVLISTGGHRATPAGAATPTAARALTSAPVVATGVAGAAGASRAPHLAGAAAQSGAPIPAPTSAADPAAVLRDLADRRAKAFAQRRPDLLATVYQSSWLLSQDADQLRSRVPAGCGLTGLVTSYHDLTVTAAGPGRFDLRVTASQPPATLVCAGRVRSRTEPAGPVRLRLRLVEVVAGYRIASEHPETP